MLMHGLIQAVGRVGASVSIVNIVQKIYMDPSADAALTVQLLLGETLCVLARCLMCACMRLCY